MTNNADAQIAREWATRALRNDLPDEAPILVAARHILATTTPPTMADVEWDDEVHTGLCAEHPMYEVVRMLGLDREDDLVERILCYLRPGVFCGLPMSSLTPIPGTKIDLTPLIPEEDWQKASDDHPEVLETEADYENAPTGTIAAGNLCFPRVKDSLGFWLVCGEGGVKTSPVMAHDAARRVLRWGESL